MSIASSDFRNLFLDNNNMDYKDGIFKRYPLSCGDPDSPATNEIRLARIYPSYFSVYRDPGRSIGKTQSHNAEVITLEVISLQRIKEDKTRFDVLSFEWHEIDWTEISICGEPFTIPEALKLALVAYFKEYAKDEAYPLLWIDYLCVNLRDPEECRAQYALMGSIYAQARRIIRWEATTLSATSIALASFNMERPSGRSLQLRRADGRNFVPEALIPKDDIINSRMLYPAPDDVDQVQNDLVLGARHLKSWTEWYISDFLDQSPLIRGPEVGFENVSNLSLSTDILQACSRNTKLLFNIAFNGLGDGLEQG
jgi:hypothetical protein